MRRILSSCLFCCGREFMHEQVFFSDSARVECIFNVFPLLDNKSHTRYNF